jgi:hypothetical protein
MTLFLPDQLTVTLRAVQPGSGTLTLSDIRVSITFSLDGRAYYRTFLGLTDENGEVRSGAEVIMAGFRSNQAMFLMDYRVPLLECDSHALVEVSGADDFVALRKRAEASSMANESALRDFRRARNATIKSARAVVELTEPVPKLAIRLSVVAAARALGPNS